MNKRTFNKHINACRTKDKKRIHLGKLRKLPRPLRRELAEYVVRNRGPLLLALAETCNDKWLNSMGYLYRTHGHRSGYTFRHTCEHQIR